ncbi:amino acid ABC transporter permease [Clostridium oceanicum]|uniref:Amino acid ABC transporter permease n=1 Tax=Clostridium oceanicum TaxID=1543 RepID=A0ABP3UPL3_9CLOT
MDTQIMIKTLPILLKGSLMTIELTVSTLIIGSILGIVLALFKLSKIAPVRIFGNFYTWIFRGTPLLLQLFFFYYGLPFIGIELIPFTAAILSLSLNCGAYMAEIIRGGIQSVDKGQFEASKTLGLSYKDTMFKVILPQTFKLIIPPVGNEFIAILKDTSLVSTISMVELMRTAQQMYSTTFKPIEIFMLAGILYLLLTTIFTSAFSIFEKRLAVYD